jgi:hypothetical protein
MYNILLVPTLYPVHINTPHMNRFMFLHVYINLLGVKAKSSIPRVNFSHKNDSGLLSSYQKNNSFLSQTSSNSLHEERKILIFQTSLWWLSRCVDNKIRANANIKVKVQCNCGGSSNTNKTLFLVFWDLSPLSRLLAIHV